MTSPGNSHIDRSHIDRSHIDRSHIDRSHIDRYYEGFSSPDGFSTASGNAKG